MSKIDINFDFRKDSKVGDPDQDSKKLYETHIILWNKDLKSGKRFNLSIINDGGRLVLKNDLYDDLSSDRMFPHYVNKYNGHFDGWLSTDEENDLQYIVRTIGGHIVFPCHEKNGNTINVARGSDHQNIADRFDLTLECIRKFYKNETSPLYDTLIRYKEFFDLFVDFSGYVDFFILQDFVDEKGNIKFVFEGDNFKRQPLPQNANEYKQYKSYITNLITKRNNRILKSYK